MSDFNWLDIPAATRKNWWRMSLDNQRRVYAYYERLHRHLNDVRNK